MLAALKVNIIQLPPAFILARFREWQLNPRLIPADLKLFISCGDVLAVETVRLWQAMLKDRVTLLNVYGPTEVTDKATFHQVEPDLDTEHLARIPIGRHLPDYMVPSAFVCLEQMPLTPSSKINRRGLPLPEVITREDTVAPRDAVELELTRIWEEVLEVPHVNIRQDFFALGGHSLLAIRLMVLFEERMGRELPLATLFQAPTIE